MLPEDGVRRTKHYLLGLVLVCFALLAGGWVYLRTTIQADVEKFGVVAQESFPRPGDDVASMIAYMQSDSHTFRERNHAVWALGQLRDPRVLPALEAAYTGRPCDHSANLCQRELSKAIDLCRGNTPNILFIRTQRSRPR